MFKSGKSFKAVTSCFKEGTIGQISLLDTPGLNDPNTERSDKSITIEMMKNLQAKLKDPTEGISSMVLCVLPNESQRITDTPIKAIVDNFIMFNSLDETTDVSVHPKFLVIFNDVSRYGEKYDPERIKNDPDYDPLKENTDLTPIQRINDLKAQIKAKAKKFYIL